MNRKGPGTTKAKKGTAPVKDEGTPEVKPPPTIVVQKEGRDSPVPFNFMDHTSQHGSQNGFGTPPVAATPLNGYHSDINIDPAVDKLEVEDDHDEQYKLWKTMTKKSRAKVSVSTAPFALSLPNS